MDLLPIESVWDFPRPPRVERVPCRVWVVFNDKVIADSTNSLRVLETSHPPVYYIPPSDVQVRYLSQSSRRTHCEFKGAATYWTLTIDGRISRDAAWSYPVPGRGFEELADHLAFYPSRVDSCFVGDERVRSQEGDFYGGWITANLRGPFKGGPGTWGW